MLLGVGSGDGVYCYITTVDNGFDDGTQMGSNVAAFVPVAITDVWFLGAGDAIQLFCESDNGVASSNVNNSSLTAILMNSTFDAAAKSKKRVSGIHSAKGTEPLN